MGKSTATFEGFDRVFPIVGGHHRFQWFLLATVSLQSCFFAFHHMGYIYLAGVPDHWCHIEGLENTGWTQEQIKNISIPRTPDGSKFEKCKHYDFDFDELHYAYSYEDAIARVDFSEAPTKACSKWTYDTTLYSSTTVSQFDLVCERQYLVATIQASYMAGVFVGSFVMGGLSDVILGRRGAVLVSVGLCLFCGFGAAFSTSYALFVFFRFIIAIGVTGSFQNSSTLLVEYSDTRCRGVVGILQMIPFAIGYMVMPIYAYYIRDWSTLQLAFTATTLILISYIWTLPESSRWLASKGREKDALKVLQGIAKRNGKPNPNDEELMSILEACRAEQVRSENSNSTPPAPVAKLQGWKRFLAGFVTFLRNYWSLLRTPELRKRSIILWILFASVTLVYYGVSFDSALLTNDPFLLVFLSGLMEVPGYLSVIPFASRWGRKPTVATTFLLSGIACLLVSVTPFDYPAFRVIFSMSGKLFISGCFSIIYVLGTELYPTATRATGLGAAVLMGRLGSISAPYVVIGMKNVYADLPSVIFGVAALIAGIVALLLPETKNAELLETIKAVEVHSNTPGAGLQSLEESLKFLPRLSRPDISQDFPRRSKADIKLGLPRTSKPDISQDIKQDENTV